MGSLFDSGRLTGGADAGQSAALAMLRGLFNAVHDAVLVTDEHGRLIDVNPSAADLLKRGRHDLLTSGASDLLVNGARLEIRQFVKLAGTGSWAGEAEVQRPDGSRALVEVCTSSVPLDDGRVYLITLRDISERRRADELAASIRRQSEAVGRQRRLVTAMLESAGEGIYGVDPEGRCTFINPIAASLLGYTPDEVMGKNLHHLVHHHRADGSPYPEANCPITRAWETGRGMRVDDEVLWRRDGSSFPVEYSAYPLVEEGTITGAVIAFNDITQRRWAEERLREETRIVETLHRVGTSLTAELDLHRLVQAITDAGRELTGAAFGAFFYNETDESGESYKLDCVSGVPEELFAGFPMPRKTPLFAPTFRGEEIICIDDVTNDPRFGQNPPHFGLPQGHLPVRGYLAVPVVSRSGEVIGGLFFGHPRAGVFTDNEVRLIAGVAAQAAIALDNARLYQRAQEALRIRDEFLASISHELRTPLTAIRGFSQLLHRRIERLAGPDAGRVLDSLTSIDASTTKMSSMVDELLDLARLQSGRLLDLHPVRTDLVDLCRRIAAEYQKTTRLHDIRVEASPERLEGMYDLTRLERIVANLLSNAIKYSPNGGVITLALTVEGPPATGATSRALLEVRDEGLGIPAADLPHVFDRFYRGGNVGRIWGTGTGLAVVHQVVEQHGGTVAIESAPGQGTVVRVRLPLALEIKD
jgi:PAS domain S-box-containing protein